MVDGLNLLCSCQGKNGSPSGEGSTNNGGDAGTRTVTAWWFPDFTISAKATSVGTAISSSETYPDQTTNWITWSRR
ncbi:hypothetical protein ACNKHQ_13230 [Shigella flexneri]